jgi:hypothetical protein
MRSAPVSAAIVLGLALVGCAPSDIPGDRMSQAVAAPLSDFNVVQAELPPALAAAMQGPYVRPTDASCDGLKDEVKELDAALGADFDTPATSINPSLIERGVAAVTDATVGTVRRTTEAIVPYRKWVRKLSGAERYSKEVAAAIAAGGARRSYLKGIGDAAGCASPAAPRR